MLRPLLCLSLLASAAAHAADLPRIFITSTTGTADLSTWPDAHGLHGLAAGDEICRTRAAAATLAGADQYIALLSDSADDAYCRLHGLHGKRADRCGEAAEPTGAGPWYRMDDLPSLDVAELSQRDFLADGYMPRHILYDETRTAFSPATPSTAYTGTSSEGTLLSACGDWSSAASDDSALSTNAFRGFGGTHAFAPRCDTGAHLVCLQRGRHGPPLSRKPAPNARRTFVTSSWGNGDFSSWPDAVGRTGIDAADAVCRAHAKRASLPLADTYKAWLSTQAVDARDRYVHDGPWFRTDGVRVAASLADLVDGTLDAPLQVDENVTPVHFDTAWTASFDDGRRGFGTCDDWTNADSDAYALFGQTFSADAYWSWFAPGIATDCASEYRVNCFADNDSLFLDSYE